MTRFLTIVLLFITPNIRGQIVAKDDTTTYTFTVKPVFTQDNLINSVKEFTVIESDYPLFIRVLYADGKFVNSYITSSFSTYTIKCHIKILQKGKLGMWGKLIYITEYHAAPISEVTFIQKKLLINHTAN